VPQEKVSKITHQMFEEMSARMNRPLDEMARSVGRCESWSEGIRIADAGCRQSTALATSPNNGNDTVAVSRSWSDCFDLDTSLRSTAATSAGFAQ
jgi:hypothetical protein